VQWIAAVPGVTMRLLRIDDLRALVGHRQWPCISVYLPTHHSGRKEIQEDPIRLKNAISQAKERLAEAGYPKDQAAKLLDAAGDLVLSQNFRLYQSDGLVAFASPDLFQYYRLPVRFRDEVVVADHFSIKQLVPLFSEDGRVFILALSQRQIRFFEATRLAIQERTVPDMPKSIADVKQYEEAEDYLQGHITVPVSRAPRTTVVFHGQGSIADKATYKKDVMQFLQAVARTVEKYLNSDTAPLILAGVEYEQSFYRQVNSYHNLLEEGIAGNPEGLDDKEIHEAAWSVVEPHFAQSRHAILSHYADLSNSDKASDRLETILPAALHGRVRTLFIRTDVPVWGNFDPDGLSSTVHDSQEQGDIDLVDLATVYVLQRQGMIYGLQKEEMPTEKAHKRRFSATERVCLQSSTPGKGAQGTETGSFGNPATS
jgi:hypothetical protein